MKSSNSDSKMKPSRPNSTGTASHDVGVPLLDEVSELLSKERSLMQLKVIEQHVEAKEWKEKYETLVKNIGSSDSLTHSLPGSGSGPGHGHGLQSRIAAYEVAADISSTPQSNSWRNDVEKQLYLLPSSDMPWYLDVSNSSLTSNDVHRILMFPKTNNYMKTSVLNFHNCGLDDSCAKLLPHLLRFPNIAAIDFSCNDVADMFQNALLAAVEARRLKLQYFLLHGNMQMANFPLENLLHHLSSSVWGLTVSLTDVAAGVLAPKPTNRISTSGTSKPPPANPIPKHSSRFLKHLNHVLDPKSGQTSPANSSTKSKTGVDKAVQKRQKGKNTEFLQPHRGAGGAHAAPQSLCVLGLMHSILCDDSISQLETTLRLTISSLTDLDLSYSFTGIKGAKVVGKMLRSRPCQLIRLNLMGNALGDSATSAYICPGLKASTTLTYLDLKSNNLTDDGLHSLTNCLKRKRTFRRLVLEGNRLSLAAVTKSREVLSRSGAPNININFGVCIAEPTPVAMTTSSVQENESLIDKDDGPIYTIPGQVSVALEPAAGTAVLYTIESQKIKLLTKKKTSEDGLEDVIAEASAGEVRLSWKMNVSDMNNSEEGDIDGMIALFSKAVVCWEVKLVSESNQVTTLCSKILLADACLPIGTHVSCSATVPKPPFRTRLEIGVKIVHSKIVKGAAKSLRVNAFGLRVFGIPANFNGSHMLYGGDMPMWSSSCNALLGEGYEQSEVPEGFVVARSLRWVGQHTQDIRLCFKAKLAASYNMSEVSGSSTVVDSTWKMADGSSVGYSWCLCRCREIGGVEVIASGVMSQNKVTSEGQENAGDDNDISGSILQPWLWREYNVKVEEAITNERFMLCVQVTSDPHIRNLKDKCKVQVNDCNFFVSGENYGHLQKDVVYENMSNPSVLFSSFNNSSVTMSI